jgi:hypothetical protein
MTGEEDEIHAELGAAVTAALDTGQEVVETLLGELTAPPPEEAGPP